MLNKKALVFESIFVALGDYISYGVAFLIGVLINRYYGTEQLGIYTLCLTLSQIIILPLNSGFSSILRRETAMNVSDASPLFSAVMVIKSVVVVSAFCLVLIVLMLFFWGNPSYTMLPLLLISKGLDNLSESIYTTYQSTDRILRCTILKVINGTVLLGTVLSFIYLQSAVQMIYWNHVAVSLLILLLCIFDFQKEIGVQLEISYKRISFLVYESLPLIVNAIFFQVGSRLNIVIIGALLNKEDLGVYAAVVSIVAALTMVTNSVGVVTFTHLSKTLIESKVQFVRLVNQFVLYFLMGGILVTLILYLASPFLLGVYGKLPLAATWTLQLMAISIIPLFVHAPLGSIFTITGRQKEGMFFSGIMLVCNLMLFYFMTKYLGLLGAAWAFVLYSIVMSCSEYLYFHLRLKKILV